MHVDSEEQKYQQLRAKPGPMRAYEEKPDPKKPSAYTSGYDFTKKGIQRMLDVRLKNRADPRSGYKILCTMDSIKADLEANERNWERINSAQVNPKAEMTGRHLDKRNYLRAKRRLCEEECRFLHELLAEVEAKEKAKREARRPVGCVKLKDGQPFRVDGRDLMQREDGEYVIEETGQMLKDYQDEVVANRQKQVARKRAADVAHACGAC